jgi:hypothetical protein
MGSFFLGVLILFYDYLSFYLGVVILVDLIVLTCITDFIGAIALALFGLFCSLGVYRG